MVDINQKVEIKLNKINIKEYKKRGYEGELGDKIIVNYKDLYKASKVYIEAVCDNPNCQKHYKITINNYKNILNQEDKRNFCKECSILKAKDTFLRRYGKSSPFEVKEIRDKAKKTVQKKYGVDYITNFQKRKIETNLKKYGSPSPLGNEQIIKKSKKTLYKNYNVDNPSQSNIIQSKIRNSFNANGTQKSSKSQRKLCEYLKGELNYPFLRYNLDVAFPKEKIDIEYNGGGHNLTVKLGEKTEQEFQKLENFRRKQLYLNGWKIITFISPKNKLPSEEECLKIYEIAKEYFKKEDRHWLEYYIDEDYVKTSQFLLSTQNFIKKYTAVND